MSHTPDLNPQRGQRRLRVSRPLLVSAAALSFLAVAGCGDDEKTSQASTPGATARTPAPSTPEIPADAKQPGTRTLAWAKDVCEAWGEGSAAIPAPSNPTSKAEVKQYLNDVAELLAEKHAALQKIGAPPVGGEQGEDAWKGYVRTVETVKRGIASIAEAPPTTADGVASQVAVIQRTRGPISSLRTDRALVLAFEQDSCKDVAR